LMFSTIFILSFIL